MKKVYKYWFGAICIGLATVSCSDFFGHEIAVVRQFGHLSDGSRASRGRRRRVQLFLYGRIDQCAASSGSRDS